MSIDTTTIPGQRLMVHPLRGCAGSPTTRHRAGGTEVAGTRARLARRGLRASLPGLLFRLVAARRCDGAERETHREDGTVAVVAAPGGNRPAVQLDDLPGNGEAEPKTPVCAAGGETDLFEAMEDAGQEVGRNAGPRVADGEPRLGLERLETDVNATALGGEHDRVAEEVGDDLTQPGRVASHQELAPADGHQLEPEAFRLGVGLGVLDGLADDRGEIGGADGEGELPGGDAGDIEQIFDEADLEAGVALDARDGPRGLRRVRARLGQEPGPGEDRRERGAELVRDEREERVFRPVRSFRLRTGEGELREPTGLLLAQRERRQVGGQLRRDLREHAQVLLVVRGSPLDEQDADDSIQADERDSEAGPGAPRRRMLFGRETARVVIREKGEQAHGTGREDAPLLSRNVGDDDESLRATGSGLEEDATLIGHADGEELEGASDAPLRLLRDLEEVGGVTQDTRGGAVRRVGWSTCHGQQPSRHSPSRSPLARKGATLSRWRRTTVPVSSTSRGRNPRQSSRRSSRPAGAGSDQLGGSVYVYSSRSWRTATCSSAAPRALHRTSTAVAAVPRVSASALQRRAKS